MSGRSSSFSTITRITLGILLVEGLYCDDFPVPENVSAGIETEIIVPMGTRTCAATTRLCGILERLYETYPAVNSEFYRVVFADDFTGRTIADIECSLFLRMLDAGDYEVVIIISLI